MGSVEGGDEGRGGESVWAELEKCWWWLGTSEILCFFMISIL